MYQRLQCRQYYFFKIKFVLFLYLASWKENDLSWYISVIIQTVGYRTPGFAQPFSWHLHITIPYNLPHLRLWYLNWRCHSNSVNTGSSLPNISYIKKRKRRNMIGIDMIGNKIERKWCNFQMENWQQIIANLKTMLVSSLPPVVCRRVHFTLFTLFVFVCP